MTGFVLTLLRLIFLALLFVFVWQVSRSMFRHVGSITPAQKKTKATTQPTAQTPR